LAVFSLKAKTPKKSEIGTTNILEFQPTIMAVLFGGKTKTATIVQHNGLLLKRTPTILNPAKNSS
jgi:hypothetical protein